MEISGINHAKDVISNASANPKIVSFLPNPTNPTIQENNNTFGVLMRILEGRKMAAFVRFPNAPNPNGGIVLFTNNGPGNATKLVGLLFLDTPLPTSAPVLSQGQQIRPPQQQQRQVLQSTMLQNPQQYRMQQLFQSARNANPGITQEQMMALLRRQQPSQQQPTQ
ncbi:7811_t:CDS:2 [Rhizophagus irregularis]|nr:7811_t:CDS:2 [Rhizophagus irregularis]